MPNLALPAESWSHVLTPVADDSFVDTLAAWNGLRLRATDVDSWTPTQARQGLVALERLTRSITATKTALIGQLCAGRDTTATIVRETGMSRRNARELRAAAKVISQHPEALQNLQDGAISTEHLSHLSHVSDELANELLPNATGMCADDYKKLVDRHRVQRESKSLAEEQRNSRSVKFFTKPNGCVGATIVLPPIEGTEFKTTIEELCNQGWKAQHPERAESLGGHDDEPRERRLADAFVQFLRGERATGKPSVVVVVNAETLEAHIVPDQPIPLSEALTAMARSDVYSAIKSAKPAQLQFGRNTRVASRLQKLAMLVYGETCVANGCNVSALNSDAHHIRWFENGGKTDLENLEWRCTGEQGHHPHVHETHLHETGPPG